MTAHRRFPFLAVTSAPLGTACALGGADAPAVTITISDSAGVQLVRNDGDPDQLDSMAIEPEEIMRIGVVDGAEEYQSDRLGMVVATDDGRPRGGGAAWRGGRG